MPSTERSLFPFRTTTAASSRKRRLIPELFRQTPGRDGLDSGLDPAERSRLRADVAAAFPALLVLLLARHGPSVAHHGARQEAELRVRQLRAVG